MGRRRGGHGGGGNEDSAMDMMSALIGCLIMILIGILVIVMVTQTMIIIVEPDDQDLEAQIVSNRDSAIASSEAFPKGNTDYEPVYIDVERSHITFYPGLTNKLVGTKVRVSDLDHPGNLLDERLKVIKESMGTTFPEYVILLVRPNAAALARRLRKEINETRGIPIGTELFESGREFVYISATRDAYEEALLKKDAKTLEQLSAPLKEGAPSGTPPEAGE